MPKVFILHIAEESDDEVSMGLGNVFSTREKAESVGQNLVNDKSSGVIFYHVTEHIVFE